MKRTIAFLPLTVCLCLLIGYNFMSAQWSPATGVPPANNAAAPINVGSVTQAKSGNFMANIMAAATSTWSPEYCDELGDNCFLATDVTGDVNLPVCSNGQTLVADATGSWVCGTATTPPSVSWLANNQHSESQCTSLGGTVQTDGGGNKFCRFVAASCPSGWAKHQNWAAYRVTTSPCGSSSCTSPARAWSNTAGAPSQSMSCRGVNGSDSWTPFQCSSAMNEVGCY